jgi:hypothetical protein
MKVPNRIIQRFVNAVVSAVKINPEINPQEITTLSAVPSVKVDVVSESFHFILNRENYILRVNFSNRNYV